VLARGIVQRYHPLTVITWIFAFGTMLLVPIGAVPLVRELPGLSLQGWLAVVWIIALPTVAAYYLNVWALLHVESSIVSTFVVPAAGAHRAHGHFDPRRATFGAPHSIRRPHRRRSGRYDSRTASSRARPVAGPISRCVEV
jgi:hypothetical protein